MIKFFSKVAIKTECVYSELNANINCLKVRKKSNYPAHFAKT